MPGPQDVLFDELDAELRLHGELGYTYEPEKHTRRWNRMFSGGRERLIRADGRLDRQALSSFRGRIFAGDNPVRARGLFDPLIARRRGERATLVRCLEILEERGHADLLRKYPSSEAGAPNQFEYRGYRYTHRWFKHVYTLGLLNRTLGGRLEPGFTSLDIGSAYGIFASLLHQEYRGSHHVLVDLPEQLLLAAYFLKTYLPGVRVAGISDVAERETISRGFLEQFDFVLLPPDDYVKLEPGSVDLVTSFAALGELKREYFEYYVGAPVFKTARYFATANPVVSSEMMADSDLTVLDFPILDPAKRLHFDIAHAYFQPYGYPQRRFGLFYRPRRFPTFFEYVGELRGEDS